MSILLKSVKGTVWLTASRLLSVVFGATAAVFIARWLGPAQYGYLPLVYSILGIAMIFGDAGLGPSTSYYLAQHQDNAELSRRILFKTLRLRLLSLIPLCLAFVLLMPWISSFVKAPLLRGTLVIFAGSLFLVQIMSRWTGKTYEGLGQATRLGRTQMFISWLSPLTQLLLVALGFGVLGAIGGQVFGNGIVVAILIVWLLRNYNADSSCDSPREDLVSYPQIIRYALPLMIIHASFFVYMQSDILILKYFRNIEDVSYYGLIAQLVVLIQIPVLSFGNATSPLLVSAAKESAQRARNLVKQSLRYVVIFYAPVVLILFLLSDSLIAAVFSEKYLPSARVLRIYLPFLFCFAISGFVSLALDYCGKARLRMVFVSISAVANVALNLWLIPKFGMLGAAWATQATYVPLVVIYLYLIKNHFKIPLKGLPVFLAKLACALAVTASLLIALGNLLPESRAMLMATVCLALAGYALALFLTKVLRLHEIRSIMHTLSGSR